MPKNPIDYANGLQYKIVCKDPAITDCYNGSCTSFKDRKYAHKCACNNPNSDSHNFKVYRFIREHGGWANWTMIQLELYPCKSEQELRLREREIFDILKPTLNMISPTFNVEKRKNYEVEYNATHIEERKQTWAEYNATHREERKKWREDHKEEYKEYYEQNKVKITCECGCVSTTQHLSRHQRSQKHLNLMAKEQ